MLILIALILTELLLIQAIKHNKWIRHFFVACLFLSCMGNSQTVEANEDGLTATACTEAAAPKQQLMPAGQNRMPTGRENKNANAVLRDIEKDWIKIDDGQKTRMVNIVTKVIADKITNVISTYYIRFEYSFQLVKDRMVPMLKAEDPVFDVLYKVFIQLRPKLPHIVTFLQLALGRNDNLFLLIFTGRKTQYGPAERDLPENKCPFVIK